MWKHNLAVTYILLLVWLMATLGVTLFARELNQYVVMGFPLGFYLESQGLLLLFLGIVAGYGYYANRLDEKISVGKNKL